MHVGGGIGQPAANSISQARGSCERRANGLERETFVDLSMKAERREWGHQVVAVGRSLQQIVKDWVFGAGGNKKRRSELHAVLLRVSRVWSPASASVTGAREAPAVFFQGEKIKIAVYFWSENSLQIHPPLVLSAPCFLVVLVLCWKIASC